MEIRNSSICDTFCQENITFTYRLCTWNITIGRFLSIILFKYYSYISFVYYPEYIAHNLITTADYNNRDYLIKSDNKMVCLLSIVAKSDNKGCVILYRIWKD